MHVSVTSAHRKRHESFASDILLNRHSELNEMCALQWTQNTCIYALKFGFRQSLRYMYNVYTRFCKFAVLWFARFGDVDLRVILVSVFQH